MDLVYFVVLVGVLIFVHELGHFVWAKFFNVRVLKFSLGFGPKLVGFKKGETEYVLAALPLGGYVKMLGENPYDVVRPGEEDRAFQNQALWKRIVIVVAGPAMNLIFPIVLFFVVFVGDGPLPPAVVGTVFPGRPADGRLLPGDRILEVDGEEVATFNDVSRIVESSPGEALRFVIDRDGQRVEQTITPVLTRNVRDLDLVDEVGRVGIMPHHPIAAVGVTSPASPAAAAGLRTFDVVVAASGKPVTRMIDLERAFAGNRGATVPLTYLRPTRIEGAFGLFDLDVYEPHVATVAPEPGGGSALMRAGIESADLYVSHVRVGSPEAEMGLRPGDRLVALDGRPVRLWATFIEDLRAGGPRSHRLTWRRGDELITDDLRLRHERGVNEYGQPFDRYVVSMRNWLPMRVDEGVPNPSPIAYAVSEALDRTSEMVELTVFSVVRLLQGRLSVKSIGGPLTIFDVAGTAAREGTLNYLTLMAFISINLGLINLLPIPLLDGGHLLFFLMEAISRRRLSVKVREYASLAGLSLLLLIMVLAFKNDIERTWPRIVDQIAQE